MGEQCHAAVSFCVAYTISKQIDQTSFANAEDTQLERVIAGLGYSAESTDQLSLPVAVRGQAGRSVQIWQRRSAMQ
jgi:hypothetical protein